MSNYTTEGTLTIMNMTEGIPTIMNTTRSESTLKASLLQSNWTDTADNLVKNLRVSVTEVQIIYILIGIFGIVGNGLCTVVFLTSKKLRRNITDQFLICQSVTDLLAAVFLIATTVSIKKATHFPGIAGYMRCVFWDSSMTVWGTFLASSYNLVAVSIEKWLQIVYPLHHKAYFDKTKAYAMMSAAWLGGYIYQMTYLIATSKVVDEECYSLAFWHSPGSKKAFGVITFIAKYLSPVAIIVACYTAMFLTLRKKQQVVGRTNKGTNKFEKAQANVLKTLFIVVACFLMCVSWNQIMFLFFNLGLYQVDFTAWWYHSTVIAYFLNCCVNPVIYVVNYKAFKLAARQLFCRNKISYLEQTTATNVSPNSYNVPTVNNNS